MLKFAFSMAFGHRFLRQLEPDIRHAVLGDAGTIISFRLGAFDAEIVTKEFQPTFTRIELPNLSNHHAYLNLMVDEGAFSGVMQDR